MSLCYFRKIGNFLPIALLVANIASAQDSAIGVTVRMSLTASRYDSGFSHLFQVYGTVMPSADHPSGAAGVTVSVPSGSAADTFLYEPGKTYTLSLLAANNGSFDLKIEPPRGYQVELDGVVRTSYSGSAWQTSNQNLNLRVIGPTSLDGRAGAASSLQNGQAVWQVALGMLTNGRPAGALTMHQPTASSSWAVTPAALHFEDREEIVAYRENGNIRQIPLNEAVVDVVTLSPSAYEIRFYPYSRSQGGAQPYGFSGFPYVTYKVEKVSDTKVKITSETRDLAATTSGNVPSSGSVIGVVDTAAPVARTAETTVERVGTGADADWTLKDWNTVGQPQKVEDQRDNISSGAVRTEVASLREPGGATATQTTRKFQTYNWGEEVQEEKRGSATSAGGPQVQTTYAYYEDNTVTGSYSQIKSVATMGGGWEAYEYDPTHFGVVVRRHRPWQNDPAAPPADLPSNTAGEITTYSYVADEFGRLTRPSLIQTRVGGRLTAQASISYASTTANNNSIVVATRVDYTDNASSNLATITKYYSESIYVSSFYRSRVHSITFPDGRKDSYAYQAGTWNGTAFSPYSPNSGAPLATPTRTVTIHGTTQSAGNAPCAMQDDYDLDDLYLVAGKSTKDVSVYDARVHLVRRETYVWTGTAWSSTPVSAANYTYNLANLPVQQSTSDGGLREATYTGEFKMSEKDASGVERTFAYDQAGRLNVAAQVSGASTTLSYDAANHLRSETIGASGISDTIVTSFSYDDAGRLRTVTPSGLGTTTYSYPSARTRTMTLPDLSTRTETYCADGRPEKIEGNAVVPESYVYAVETNGQRTTTIRSGGLSTNPALADSNAARWRKRTADWLDRTIQTERPGFTGQPAFVENYFYESGTGRLFKHTEPAPTGSVPLAMRYEYDALSQLVRSGLDLGDNGLVLVSNDRIVDTNRSFEYWNGSWWLRSSTSAYPAGSDSAIQRSLTRTRLTGLSNGQAEVQATDSEGNLVTTTTTVNRSTKTVVVSTTRSGISGTATQTFVNGFAMGVTGYDGLSTTSQYDALGRFWKSTDSRSNTTTTTYYSNTDRVQTITDGAGNAVSTVYYDPLGRVLWTRDAQGNYTRYDYNPRGQVIRSWGGGTLPVAYGYDALYGDRVTLNTYRGGGGWSTAVGDGGNTANPWPASTAGTADTTTWTYDGPSGLLSAKADANNKSVAFTYNQRGQIATRTWARGVTTTYGYSSATGELTSQTYSDGTPAVSYAYTRWGQLDTVRDVTSSSVTDLRDFVYDPAKPWRLSAEALPAYYGSRVVTPLYESANVVGRDVGFQLGASAGSSSDLEQTWAYTTSAGRFDTRVTKRASNSVTRTFQYGYLPNAPLVNSLSVVSGSFAVSYGYDTQRDLLTSIDSQWSATSRTRYNYTYNTLAQQDTAKQAGDAFGDFGGSTYHRYAYDGRGQLLDATAFLGEDATSTTAPQLPGRHHAYTYDTIGSRLTSSRTGTAGAPDDYLTNSLNQYASRENNVAHTAGTVANNTNITVGVAGNNGATLTAVGRAGRYWDAQATLANTSAPSTSLLTVTASLPGGGSNGATLVRTDTRTAYLAAALQSFSHDFDGNLIGDGVWNYAYDAENRLIQMTTTSAAISVGFPNRTVEFKYDYLGRRVQKRSLNATAGTDVYRRYLYDGWNVVAEFDAPGGTSCGNLLRSFTWGLDISGSASATGGVGALLQITDGSATYLPTYDGNGNVAALLDGSSGAVVAKYEYSPFGELLRAEGSYAASNPFRFSTKFIDDETGLVYYGHRYYSPANGRFITRDPIEEAGGINLYGFCGNDGVNGFDVLGMGSENRGSDRWQPSGPGWVFHRGIGDIYEGQFPDDGYSDRPQFFDLGMPSTTTAGPSGNETSLAEQAGRRVANSGPNPNERKRYADRDAPNNESRFAKALKKVLARILKKHPDAYEDFKKHTSGQRITITRDGGIYEERTYKDRTVKKVRVGDFGGTIDDAGNITIDQDSDAEIVVSRVFHESIHRGQGGRPSYTPGDYDGWKKAQATLWDNEVEAYMGEANWQISAGLDPAEYLLNSSGKPDEKKIREWVQNQPAYKNPYVPSSAEIAAARAGSPPPAPRPGGTAPPPVKFPIVRRSSSVGTTIDTIIFDDQFFRGIEGGR